MMKWIKRTLITLVLVLIATLIGGSIAIWPMNSLPITTLHIKQPSPKEQSLPKEQRLASLPLPTVAPDAAQPPTPTVLAGIAERDITTPIGIPKMGYSAWAREADGFRTRLKARAFYLKGEGSQPVVIVQADLPASSLVLRHKVAETVAKATDIPFSAITIHATHTHSGPGQYYESDFYNTFGSNKPGFDPDVFSFLAQQISDAVIDAWRTRQPARIAVGETEIYGATKNRSIGAYVQNHNVQDKRADDAAALRAVNPKITLVRIDVQDSDSQWKPLGAFSTFAIHGTGIPPFTHPYHGDVWAFMERDLETRITNRYHPSWKPIHGPFEANHGDNNPNYHTGLRGDSETRRIGLMIARQTWALFRELDSQLKDNLVIRHAMREIDLLNPRGDEAQPLCDRAIVGAATVGAAKGDEVFPISYLPPFAAGWPKKIFADNCHAQKNWMLSWLQVWGLQSNRYPHRVNASASQIGDLVLIGLPFEITFESGNRIRAAVRQALTAQALQQQTVPPTFIAVSSHTNGFFGYSTTPEEYSQQYYEGGHTIYGPGTTEFLSRTAAKLVTDMTTTDGFSDLPPEWTFSLATEHYFPAPRTAKGQRSEIQPAVYIDNKMEREGYWAFEYIDVNPSQLALHDPLLRIEIRQGKAEWAPMLQNHHPLTDQGYDLQIRYLDEAPADMGRYEVRWYNPPVAAGDTQYRIVVAARAGQPEFQSTPFGASMPL